MKVSREQAARTRERILEEAAKLFRERGFNGVGVANLMKEAGLTHGGFYGHFSSKEDLIAQACIRAFAEKTSMWRTEREWDAAHPLRSMAGSYLTAKHRDEPGSGCPLATLATDVSRQPLSVRGAFTGGLRELLGIVAENLPGMTEEQARQKAISSWATLVGAMVLARAVDDTGFADEILEAARASFREA